MAFLFPALLGSAVVLGLFGHLLSPGRTLAARDVVTFHLPLRVDLVRLVHAGDLSWNPYLHAGQPLLSNPSYAAFYPPTWLLAAVSPDAALDLSVVLHAALAFAGAWRFGRRLGCGQGGAALAAVGYAAGGGTLSLVHALNLFFGVAWFPWALAAGHATLAAPAGRRLRPAMAVAVVLAMTALNGEPVTVSIAVLGLGALVAGRWLSARGRRRPDSSARLAAAGYLAAAAVLALALSAAQVVPTLARLTDSPRAAALPAESTVAWSAPPQRVAELVWPRFFGDPMRVQEDLWFGWRLHDREFPYVASLYPGLLIVILAATALARRSTPLRWGWVLAIAGGCFLALGRYNPVFAPLLDAVPWLGRVRYPEKYALLAVGVLPFAAALGWERLLAALPSRRPAADLPLALAAAAVLASVALALALAALPSLAAGLVAGGSGAVRSLEAVAAGGRFLAGEAWTAAGLAALVAGLLALVRAGRSSAVALSALAVLILGVDLGRVGHRMVPALPSAELRRPPPPIAANPAVREGRLFSDQAFAAGPDVVLRGGDPRLASVRTDLRRLDPYAPNLWGVDLALHEDYDLMLTGWARHALDLLRREYAHPVHALRILGAWDIQHLALRRPVEEVASRLESGEAVEPVELRSNPEALPRYRFVRTVERHPDLGTAVAAARTAGFALAERDHWIGGAEDEGAGPGAVARPWPAGRVLGREQRGGRVRIVYAAPAGGDLVAALTYDDGWSGSVDGEPVRLSPTALGQIGVELPATGDGTATLVLRYRDRWVPLGITVSLAAWAALAAAALARLWRRRR